MADDLFTHLSRAARAAPRTPALLFGDERRDHGALFDAPERSAAGLARRGVVPGDRVAFFASPSPDFVVAVLAALRAGAMLVPINTAYRRREIAHILADATPRLLFVGDGERPAIDEIPAEDLAGAAVLGLRELESERREQGGDGSAHVPDPSLPSLGEDDPALMLYTSGTTGRSKGAELSQGNVIAMIEALRSAWEWSPSDRLLLTLPLFHLHGLVVGLFSALASGATVLLEPRFDAARVVDRLAAGEATLFFGVPTLYVRLVEELERRRRSGAPADLSAVRLFVSGSAPLAPETFAAFEALTGQAILERYGMSETGMLLSNPLRGRRIAGSVGKPLPGVEARLVDPAGGAVAPGGEGEIEVRGPSVFSRYRNAPDKSAESFRAASDGGRPWFRTGDLARVDPESGHFFLLGRASELILSGGFNVYPREIEEVLLAFPGVREAAVAGERHPEFGESPVAYLVTDRPLDAPALDALADHCRRELAAFKLPRRFVRLEALPRNAMGKVEKRRLAESR